MSLLNSSLSYIIHLDQYIQLWSQSLGAWTYVILFFIIFAETGLVIFPFLPGDSLLFAVGATAALAGSGLNIYLLIVLLAVAAIVGNLVNYQIGRSVGPKVFNRENSVLFNKDYLIKAQSFYDKYGGRAIVLTRFVPIVRTFVPFVSGIGRMNYGRFLAYNIAGGVSWILIFLGAGFYFGNLPMVQKNFHIVILGVIVISMLPIAVEYLKAKMASRKA